MKEQDYCKSEIKVYILLFVETITAYFTTCVLIHS